MEGKAFIRRGKEGRGDKEEKGQEKITRTRPETRREDQEEEPEDFALTAMSVAGRSSPRPIWPLRQRRLNPVKLAYDRSLSDGRLSSARFPALRMQRKKRKVQNMPRKRNRTI